MPQLTGDGGRFLTIDDIMKEALRLLVNDCVLVNRVHRVTEQFSGQKGDTVSVRLPARVKSTSGRTIGIQPMIDQTVPVTVQNQENVGLSWHNKDMTLSIVDFGKRYLASAASQIAHAIDVSIQQEMAMGFFYGSGTPGTAANTSSFNYANAHMTNVGVPRDGALTNILNPLDAAEVREQLKTVYNPDMVRTAIERASIGRMAQAESYETAHMLAHTTGAFGGTPLVNGASQLGNTLVVDGGPNSVTGWLKKGDTFTIDGVYEVNPRTYLSTGRLQRFKATADVDTDGAGNASIPIIPAINDGTATLPDGEGANLTLAAYQNVTNAPADNAGINLIGAGNTAYRQNMRYHRDAVMFAPIQMHKPETASLCKMVRDPQTGISLMMTGGYNVTDGSETVRLDALWAVKTVYGELGHMIWSAQNQ